MLRPLCQGCQTHGPWNGLKGPARWRDFSARFTLSMYVCPQLYFTIFTVVEENSTLLRRNIILLEFTWLFFYYFFYLFIIFFRCILKLKSWMYVRMLALERIWVWPPCAVLSKNLCFYSQIQKERHVSLVSSIVCWILNCLRKFLAYEEESQSLVLFRNGFPLCLCHQFKGFGTHVPFLSSIGHWSIKIIFVKFLHTRKKSQVVSVT